MARPRVPAAALLCNDRVIAETTVKVPSAAGSLRDEGMVHAMSRTWHLAVQALFGSHR